MKTKRDETLPQPTHQAIKAYRENGGIGPLIIKLVTGFDSLQEKVLYFSQPHTNRIWSPHSIIPYGYGGSSTGCEAGHSPATNYEIKIGQYLALRHCTPSWCAG
jgi:hypothetical protein